VSTSPDRPTPTQPAPAPAPAHEVAPGTYENQLRAYAEQVRCHVPVQPERPGQDTDPVPLEIFYNQSYDPDLRTDRPVWTVRFVLGLTPSGRTRRWGWAHGPTLTEALVAAHTLQRNTGRSNSPTHPPRHPRSST
jgi:hypothetical protein